MDPPAPSAVDEAAPGELRLSVIIPATDKPPTLSRCVAAIKAASDPPTEILVVDGPVDATPVAARNRGAALATGDILVFIDSDVEVHDDTFRRVRDILTKDTGMTAVFGSYDDRPGDGSIVSQFRNMHHHYVHQASPGAIETFWTGLGAVRRDAFFSVGGFAEHELDDVEFGMRLCKSGGSIVLEPQLQCTHLKRWTIRSMVMTDLLKRGAPWTALALEYRTVPNHLNLTWRHRLSAAFSIGSLVALVLRRPAAAIAALSGVFGLNRSFYGLMLRRRGPVAAAAGIGLHVVHYLTAVAAVPTGIALYATRRYEPDDRRGRYSSSEAIAAQTSAPHEPSPRAASEDPILHVVEPPTSAPDDATNAGTTSTPPTTSDLGPEQHAELELLESHK